MGSDHGSKGKGRASMEILRGMEDKKVTQGRTGCPLKSASNVQDKIYDTEALSVEQTIVLDETGNMDLDIIGYSDNSDGGPKNECKASTENSSSFGNTLSGTDYGSLLSDEEVESQFYGNGSALTSNGYREVFPRRKKKLTVHWRKFISPLMWRCKWLELQIKKLQSQKLKYDRELAFCDQRKHADCENFSMEGFDVKSLGFSSQAHRHGVMKRKKRKKTEETSDIAAYMAHHNLFSYYEKKRSLADMSLEDNIHKLDKTNIQHDDIDDFETRTNEGWPSSMMGDNNDSLENILSKIEAAQSKLLNLKGRIEKVVNENPMNFSSNQPNFLTSCDDPGLPEDGNDMLVRSLHEASQHMSEHEFGDVLIPETAIRSHEEVLLLPVKIEKTPVGLSRGTTGKGLLQSCEVKKEMHFTGKVKGELTEQPQILEEQKPISPAAVSQADFTSKNTEPNAQHKVKSLSAVKTTVSKRGRRRRTGSNKQKQRSTG